MRRLTVDVVCAATVTERWTLEVTDEEAAAIADDVNEALDLLSERFVAVENVEVENEREREVVRVEEVQLSHSTCRHCGRTIVKDGETWVDPEATGDDSIWRETCDAHDTFTAEHEPV